MAGYTSVLDGWPCPTGCHRGVVWVVDACIVHADIEEPTTEDEEEMYRCPICVYSEAVCSICNGRSVVDERPFPISSAQMSLGL